MPKRFCKAKSLLYFAQALFLACLLLVGLSGCSNNDSLMDPRPGPDKQGLGLIHGAATGAGSGAVTGFQIGAGTGPGALVGAGLGAIAGSIKGIGQDLAEEELLVMAAQSRAERTRAVVHEQLHDHYKRRLELHPGRDIFPADMFFFGDEVSLRPDAVPLVRELAQMNKDRLPYSRLYVVVYSKVNPGVGGATGIVEEQQVEEGEKRAVRSTYAEHLTTMRSREIVNYLVQSGLEPRRLVARGILVDKPVLIDPLDDPLRYNQAVEIIALDR